MPPGVGSLDVSVDLRGDCDMGKLDAATERLLQYVSEQVGETPDSLLRLIEEDPPGSLVSDYLPEYIKREWGSLPLSARVIACVLSDHLTEHCAAREACDNAAPQFVWSGALGLKEVPGEHREKDVIYVAQWKIVSRAEYDSELAALGPVPYTGHPKGFDIYRRFQHTTSVGRQGDFCSAIRDRYMWDVDRMEGVGKHA